MDKPSCASCQYFTRPGVTGTAYGVCVRFPMPVDHHQDFWCGEYAQTSNETKFKEPVKKPKY
jgi:hypothetical protein